MDVDWDDRFDEDIIEKVANYRKYIVDLGDEHGGRQEFITAYDMIEHLREHLPNMMVELLLLVSLLVTGMQRKRLISVSSAFRMCSLPLKREKESSASDYGFVLQQEQS